MESFFLSSNLPPGVGQGRASAPRLIWRRSRRVEGKKNNLLHFSLMSFNLGGIKRLADIQSEAAFHQWQHVMLCTLALFMYVAQSNENEHKKNVNTFLCVFFLLTDSDVSVVATASRLSQRPLQPPGAAGDRAELVRNPVVPHCVRLTLPPRFRCQGLW